MSGDPYIKENERLEAEIARLQESVNYLQIADNHHQELMAEKEEEIDRLRAELEIAHQSDTDYQAHIENARLQADLNFQYERVANKDCEIARLTDENRNMNATLAKDASVIFELQAALEEIAKGHCSNCWSYPCTNSPAIARKALAKEGK